jgi:hypothetical protein
MKNCILLGGSNSVLKYGIGSGLESKFNVTRLGLGATSCIQNLYEITKNITAVSQADLIVTESNVNDSFHVNKMNMPMEQMLFQIDEFYRVLSNSTRRVYVILLPINIHAPHIESTEVINTINEQHYRNIQRYQFRMVDLTNVIKRFDKVILNKLIPHPRHINEALLHQLGINIANHLEKNNFFIQTSHNTGYQYSSIMAKDICIESMKNKKNSIFSEMLINTEMVRKLDAKYYGKTIVAIAAWSDGYSLLQIQNEKDTIIKAFSNLNTVTELLEPILITKNTSFESILSENLPTEKTALVSRKKDEIITTTLLIGFLIRDGVRSAENTSFFEIKNLEELIPQYEPYIKAIDSYLQNQQLT